MKGDVATMLRDAAPAPRGRLDFPGVQRRAARSRWLRRFWVGTAAVLGVGLVVGSTLVFVHDDTASRRVSVGPASDPSDFPLVNSSGRTDAPPGWERTATFPGQPSAIASSEKGIVAAGYGIWFSTDGVEWRQAIWSGEAIPAAPEPGSVVVLPSVSDVIATNDGFVAVGSTPDEDGHPVAAVWTSADGMRWERSSRAELEPATPPIPAGVSTARGTISAVTSTPLGLVAVGRVFNGQFIDGTLLPNPWDFAVWTSEDGTQWRRVASSHAFGVTRGSNTRLTGVFTHGSKIYAVAAGGGTTIIWESDDASHWDQVTRFEGDISEVIETQRSLIATGSAFDGGDQSSVIWRATDPASWTIVYRGSAMSYAGFSSIASKGRSILAIGAEGSDWADIKTIAVESNDDGATWQSATTPGVFVPFSTSALVTRHDGNYVVLVQESVNASEQTGRFDVGVFTPTGPAPTPALMHVEYVPGVIGARSVVATPTGIWVSGDDGGNRYVARIDPVTGMPGPRIAIDGVASRIAYDQGRLWVFGGGDGAEPIGTVSVLDANDGHLIAKLLTPPSQFGASALAFANGDAWVTSTAANEVVKLHLDDNRLVLSAYPVGAQPTDIIATSSGALWVRETDDRTLARIDPNTGSVVDRVSWTGPLLAAAGNDAIWTTEPEPAGRLVQLNPASLHQGVSVSLGARLRVPDPILAVAQTPDGVCGRTARSLMCWHTTDITSRADPEPFAQTPWAQVQIASNPNTLTSANGTLWATDGKSLVRWTP